MLFSDDKLYFSIVLTNIKIHVTLIKITHAVGNQSEYCHMSVTSP